MKHSIPWVDEYRHVFMKDDISKKVLGDILMHCHFGATLTPENPAMVAEHNVGVFILSRCGVFSQGTASQVLNALSAVMPEQQEVEG